jgi:hypothetical protein
MRSDFTSSSKEETIVKITTVGMDLAKQVFQVHGADAQGNEVLRKKLNRCNVLEFFTNLPPCAVGMEHAAVRTTGRASSRPWVMSSS